MATMTPPPIDMSEIDALEDEEATFCYGCDNDFADCECPQCPICHQPLSRMEQDDGRSVCGFCEE